MFKLEQNKENNDIMYTIKTDDCLVISALISGLKKRIKIAEEFVGYEDVSEDMKEFAKSEIIRYTEYINLLLQ